MSTAAERVLAPLVATAIAGIACIGCGPGAPAPRSPGPFQRAFLSVEHQNRMGRAFDLVRIRVQLDEGEVFVADATREQPFPGRLCLHRASVAPGTHRLEVELLYRGHGYGVFAYLDQYRFPVESHTDVDVPSDALGVHVVSIGYENGGITTPIEDRPSIRFELHVERSDVLGGCPPAD